MMKKVISTTQPAKLRGEMQAQVRQTQLASQSAAPGKQATRGRPKGL